MNDDELIHSSRVNIYPANDYKIKLEESYGKIVDEIKNLRSTYEGNGQTREEAIAIISGLFNKEVEFEE